MIAFLVLQIPERRRIRRSSVMEKGGVFFILLGQRVGTKCWGCVRLTW